MRRIQICVVYSCFGIIWIVVLKKEVRNKFTKIDQADLDSSRQELSNSGLEIVVALAVFFGNYFFACFCWGSNPTVYKTSQFKTFQERVLSPQI